MRADDKPDRWSLAAEKPTIVAAHRRDLADLAGALQEWLAGQLPQGSDFAVSNLAYPLGAGISHETILFDAEWRQAGARVREELVVRIKPVHLQVFQEQLFEEQFRMLELMHRTGAAPVARPRWYEPDPSVLGAPFFVMAQVRGRVAVSFPPYSKQGWLFEARPDQRRRLWEDSVRVLAGIQRLPIGDAPFLDKGVVGFEQEVDRWARYIDWADPEGGACLLRSQWDRLMAAQPVNRPDGIVWGDARIGNMMVDDDFRVVAVMDWEQASLGGALHDLGWWLYIERTQTEHQDLGRLDGMGTREETIALWHAVSGKPADDVDWYEAFAALKMEAITARMVNCGAVARERIRAEPGLRTKGLLDAAGSPQRV